jgi:chloramphenicol-sensitive protein RarD
LHFYQAIAVKLNKYYAACISAFAIWGFVAFPLRALADYPSPQILFFRIMVAAGLMLLLSVLFLKNNYRQTYRLYQAASPAGKRQFLLYTPLGGIFLGINWLAFIYVVNHVSIQTASFSYLICPILTAVLAFLLLKEDLRANQWAAIGLSLLSLLLIGTDSFLNLVYSLIIALSYAFYLLTQRLLRQYDKLVLMTLQLVLVFALMIPFQGWFLGEGEVQMDGHFLKVIFVLSVVFTILPLFLSLFSLKELKSSTLGILMYINPIINFVVAFVFFQEQTTPQKVVAYVLIFLSVLLYNFRFKALTRSKKAFA